MGRISWLFICRGSGSIVNTGVLGVLWAYGGVSGGADVGRREGVVSLGFNFSSDFSWVYELVSTVSISGLGRWRCSRKEACRAGW